MSNASLALRLRVSEQTVAVWLAAREAGGITGKDLALAGIALGVSIRWLALGTGSPEPIGLKEARGAHLP